MKIAFLLKGAISKATGKSSRPEEIDRKGPYVNFTAGARSIKKHIIEANPECAFDFFLHSWHPDLQEELLALYQPVSSLFESNAPYRKGIIKLLRRSGCKDRFYGQASMCLSIKKVTELLQSHNESYDLVIFYRYDVLLWKDLVLSTYHPSKIYANGHVRKGVTVGDFHFVMSHENALAFGLGLYDSISRTNQPRDHVIIREYVRKFMHVSLTPDSIVPEKHQEVIRKLQFPVDSGSLAVPVLLSFGLTEKEIGNYNWSAEEDPNKKNTNRRHLRKP